MQTKHVKHHELGEGILIQKHQGGSLWEVSFPSGQRYRLPSREFETSEVENRSDADRERFDSEQVSDQPYSPQHLSRRILETLRRGIVPLDNVQDLSIGLEHETNNLNRALDRTLEHGGDALAIIADYGFGKSHFVELAAQQALAKDFIVASCSLDLVETPPNKAREIYKALVHHLRYPDTDERGLKPLLRKAVANPSAIQQFIAQKPIDDCPLSAALMALDGCNNQSAYDGIVAWISGNSNVLSVEGRQCLQKPPKLYMTGEVARQYTYLLSGISTLASLVGYGGLAVLIDESEHYSLLRIAQREKANSFFQAMIFATVGETNKRIDIATIPDHQRANYPPRFTAAAHMFFMFATTDTDDRMPVEKWLAPSQQIRLDDRFLKDDILKFAKRVLEYHCHAYAYEVDDRYKRLIEKVAATLSRTLNQHRINIRQLIQLIITVCDLMFLHPDYTPELINEELSRGLGG